MSHQNGWMSTPVGRLARFIGSVKFAVPVLALAAVAMVWGTWVDSTVGRAAAMGGVYGSWWFVLLMAMICASLVLSVVVRYPWQRKHIGFIIVHASLIALIVLGFYTMNTKIEGRIVLEEGESSGYILMDERWVQLVEHTEQGFVPIEHTMLAKGPDGKTATGKITLGGHTLTILEVWANSEEVTKITNDGENPLHAVEILSEPGQVVGDWVGQIEATQAAPMLNGFAIRVVPTGQTWTPPTDAGPTVVWIDDAGQEHPLPAPGEPLGKTGWTVTQAEYFERATIGAGGTITERELGPPNPAIRLTITHTNGAVEQQIAFERFRDSPFVEQLEGETASGLSITYRGESFTDPTLAIMRDENGRIHALYAEPDGTEVSYIHDGKWPWEFTVAGTKVTILQDFAYARASRELEERPEAETNSPAIVVTAEGSEDKTILRWNTPTPIQVGEETLTLRYGPKTMQLPFVTQLIDFRKLDYPGSQMAMAYESDVMITTEGREPFPFRIYMNHPYKQDGWKVYQSGFVGDTITVLQVTKDPGLVPTYLACTTLCIGILITFYSRSWSWGHPDIPMPFKPSRREKAQEV